MPRILDLPRRALRGLSSSTTAGRRPRSRRRLILELLEDRRLMSTGVTAATGGSAISADTTGSSFTTLSGPALDDINISTGTIILNAPDGFVFNTDVADAPTVLVTHEAGAGADVAGSVTSVTSSQITYTVTTAGSGNEDLLTWDNVQVQPAAGTPLASGNLYETGTSTVEVVTQGSGGTNFGTLTEVAGAPSFLGFPQQPSSTVYGSVISPAVTVAVEDQFGNVTDSNASISLALVGAATLGGTNPISAIAGIATFSDLTVSAAAANYRLVASSIDLPDGVSATFDITPAPLTITATSDSKVYDGTTSSTAIPTTSTLYYGDTVTGLTQAFSSKDVLGTGGSTLDVTGYTINDGNGGNDYTVTLGHAPARSRRRR